MQHLRNFTHGYNWMGQISMAALQHVSGKCQTCFWKEDCPTLGKWNASYIYDRLKQYPTSYPPEDLLKNVVPTHRSCHLMHRRFKLIYFYDDATDTIHIMDIWDTRMSPTTLTKSIKWCALTGRNWLLLARKTKNPCLFLCRINFSFYLCTDLGEKSRVADALAFISHLTEKT